MNSTTPGSEIEPLVERIPSKLGDYIDAVKMSPSRLGLWLERFVQSKTDTTGYGWDDRWKAQRAREMLDYLGANLEATRTPEAALPRIPTPEMIAAAWEVIERDKLKSGIAKIGPGLGVREIWQAMFDAALAQVRHPSGERK